MCGALLLATACKDSNRPPSPPVGEPRLADRYPCDRGIAGDPAVVWTEDFEEGSVAAVTARYNDYKNAGGMVLVSDRPTGSCGAASMQFTADGRSSTTQATDLYKNLAGSATDEFYVRWYVKYQAGVPWHHTGVWFGGYNPASDWPNPQAGTRPAGDDRVSFAMEPVWGSGAANPVFDFYNYWMKMHTCSGCGGSYWGNALISRTGFIAADNAWACLEVHAKLNTDMASDAGAVLEVWKNDILIQRFPETGAVGYWVQDHFCPAGADGSQCNYSPTVSGPTDLQFRTTTDLKLNAFWPQNYITDPAAGSVWFDDMVIASARVGCLS
ncbi:MAG: hypothetical protein DMD60_14180 [Gemmatimonadetes bacterium]|nr:MAG: hypothetical protein DMD60_14180 [Gemmatimonadota bacterium]